MSGINDIGKNELPTFHTGQCAKHGRWVSRSQQCPNCSAMATIDHAEVARIAELVLPMCLKTSAGVDANAARARGIESAFAIAEMFIAEKTRRANA